MGAIPGGGAAQKSGGWGGVLIKNGEFSVCAIDSKLLKWNMRCSSGLRVASFRQWRRPMVKRPILEWEGELNCGLY